MDRGQEFVVVTDEGGKVAYYRTRQKSAEAVRELAKELFGDGVTVTAILDWPPGRAPSTDFTALLPVE